MEETQAQPPRGLKKLAGGLLHILKSSVVLLVALAAAGITCIFVPFDGEYLDYFDWQTLACLFCTLAVVAAFKDIKFFSWLADIIVRRFKNMRNIVLALVFVTYFGSMIMANDMALITFLPLGYFVLDSCGNKKLTAFTFIMQNIAANLGGMLTPFGNPQNLYLYSYFSIPTGEFFAIMAIPFAAAFVLILAVCLFVRPQPAAVGSRPKAAPPAWRIAAYSALFVLSVLIVFRAFPYYWGLLAVVVCLLALDFRSLLRVDYGLLLTFCAFFVFSGNLARIPAVQELFGAGSSPSTRSPSACSPARSSPTSPPPCSSPNSRPTTPRCSSPSTSAGWARPSPPSPASSPSTPTAACARARPPATSGCSRC